MRPTAPRFRTALAALALFATGAAPAAAQDAPLRVVVDRIAGATLYVPVGRLDGISAGDTLLARHAEGGATALVIVIAATDTRASLVFAGRPFPVTRGDALLLTPRAAGGAEPGAEPVPDPARPAAGVLPAPGGAPEPFRAHRPRGVSVTGAASLDLDVQRAESRWDGPGMPASVQTTAIPALRVSARATGLPGGLEAETGFRAAHRSAPALAGADELTVRVYQASLGRAFETFPLDVRLGRFFNRHSDFGAYWDGLMVRAGGPGGGVGAAAGWRPVLGSQGFSTDIRKASAFGDLAIRTGALHYRGELTVLDEREAVGPWSRTYAGLSQRAGWRGLTAATRIELDLAGSGVDEPLARATADLGVPLGATRLSVSWALDRPRPHPGDSGLAFPATTWRRATIGLSGRAGPLGWSASAGETREDGRPRGRSADASLHLPARGILPADAGVVLAAWDDGETTALFAAPSLARRFGRTSLRAGYQLYRVTGTDALTLHGAELSVTGPLAGDRLRASLSARAEGADGLTRLALRTTLRYALR